MPRQQHGGDGAIEISQSTLGDDGVRGALKEGLVAFCEKDGPVGGEESQRLLQGVGVCARDGKAACDQGLLGGFGGRDGLG